MSRSKEQPEVKHPLLAKHVAAMEQRREALKGRGNLNVQPTIYLAPTADEAEALLVLLIADPDWCVAEKQLQQANNGIFNMKKRNLAAGEQVTIMQYGYNTTVRDIVLTITGKAAPKGAEFVQQPVINAATGEQTGTATTLVVNGITIKTHEVAKAEKDAAKAKEARKSESDRKDAFARLGV